jgi:indolepyruvate ferredoxin oxidoreductase beta subunit
MSVSVGDATYPGADVILAGLRDRAGRVIPVDALPLAEQAGSARTVNTVLLAALSAHLETDPDVWERAVLRRVPEKTRDVNREAFRLGRQAAAD